MKLFNAFTQKAPNRVFLSILLGGFAGVLYSLLIPLVLSSLSAGENQQSITEPTHTFWFFEVSNYKLAITYLVVCSLILICRSLSEIILARVATEASREVRTRLYKRISGAPIAAIEQMGQARLVAAINLDVPRIIMGARTLPSLLVNSITLVGMLAFLLFLNPEIFQLVLIAIAFGVICFQIPMIFSRRLFMQSRQVQDQLQGAYKGLINGAKELKLDQEKRNNFFQKTLNNFEQQIEVKDKRAQTLVRTTITFGDLISFFVIGAVTFIFLNHYSISTEELVGVIMALLYVSAPIGVILNAIPQLTVASVSFRKVNRLLNEIPEENISQTRVDLPDWQRLTFQDLEYEYPGQDGDTGFHIGPLNLEIRKGEIVFIVGANGSGKSTLSKLITLHYKPKRGSISFDNTEVNDTNLVSFRQQIGCIYTDFHLFEQLLVDIDDQLLATANQYLEDLGLSSKVSIEDGHFSTLSLSTGQRKRLALLVAFLEDKSLYLFDEWAADQDPIFKNVFYTKILPNLRDQGKAVVIISHDDRYFDIADNILVMEQGALTTPDKAQAIAVPERLSTPDTSLFSEASEVSHG